MRNASTKRKKELHQRRDFLRKSKHACKNSEVMHKEDTIIYHRWAVELDQEVHNLREKDRKLTEHILELANIYDKVNLDDAAVHPHRPPRLCNCTSYQCIHSLVIM